MSAAKGFGQKRKKTVCISFSNMPGRTTKPTTRNSRDFMKVNQGDHRARIELAKGSGKADLAVVRDGFIEGRNDPGDVDGMIKLFLRFHSNKYISRAIVAWTNADEVIAGFMALGDRLHGEIHTRPYSQQRVDAILNQIDPAQ